MKKLLQNILVRALCILVLGVVLIVYSERITIWIVMMCGLLFIIPGTIAVISYFRPAADGLRRPMLNLVVGVGSIFFGLTQLIWPELFINALMFLLATILLLAAGTQFYTLWDMRRSGIRSSLFYYAIPTLELAAGLFILLSDRREAIAGLPMIVIGAGFIVYALLELWILWYLKRAVAPAETLLPEEQKAEKL